MFDENDNKCSLFCLRFSVVDLKTLNLPPFYPIFACVDTDPYFKYESGSRKLLNTDPIRIRIHNTAKIAIIMEANSYTKFQFDHKTDRKI